MEELVNKASKNLFLGISLIGFGLICCFDAVSAISKLREKIA